ncbi:retrovirus-related pol polyprotein from transposon TNT 1-94 [Tanacetum coccineum]
MEVLHTLHMDLCGPMRVQSIIGKKYILVIMDDYSRFTWVKFLRSKDETLEFVINILKQIQVGLNKTVRYIRTDNRTEFVNQVMSKYYEGVGIFHQKSIPRTPQQNGIVERQNRTLVEAARTMLIFSKAQMFLWAEAVATTLFGALCYPTNDSEDLGKLQAKADIGIFRWLCSQQEGFSNLQQKNPSRLIPNQVHATNYVLPTDKDLELLFQPMFDEYFKVTTVDAPIPSATAVNIHVVPLVIQHDVTVRTTIEDTPITQVTLHPSNNPVTGELGSAQSSSRDVSIAGPNQFNQPPAHLR